MNERPTFTRSFETQKIVKLFGELLDAGDHRTVAYSELDALTGVTTQTSCCLTTAQNVMLSERNALFVRIRGQGVRLATIEDQQEIGSQRIARVRNAATKGLKQLAAVQYDKLSDEAKREHNVAAAVLQLGKHVTSAKSHKLIADRAGESIPKIEDTLSMFKNGN